MNRSIWPLRIQVYWKPDFGNSDSDACERLAFHKLYCQGYFGYLGVLVCSSPTLYPQALAARKRIQNELCEAVYTKKSLRKSNQL
jgi:hypothetical protein